MRISDVLEKVFGRHAAEPSLPLAEIVEPTHAQRLLLEDLKEFLQTQPDVAARIKNDILSLVPASPAQYADFLAQHLRRGGVITHTYDYPFSRSQILIATRDAVLPTACGAAALDVIVPEGMNVRFDAEVGQLVRPDPERGAHNHGKLYPGENQFVPVYPDIIPLLRERGLNIGAVLSELRNVRYG